MKYAILWSGGVDSTYLCLKLLREGHDVTALWVGIDNNVHKCEMEKRAREAISEKLYEMFTHTWHFRDQRPLFSMNAEGALPQYAKFHQMPVWIYACHWIATTGEFDAIAIGYVMNDDAVSYLDDFRRAYESMKFNFEDDELFTGLHPSTYPRLHFPLFQTKKQVIYAHMEKAGLLGFCWTCEMPTDYRPCGECPACMRRDEIDELHAEPKKESTDIIVDGTKTLSRPSLSSINLDFLKSRIESMLVPHHIVGSENEDSPFHRFASHGMTDDNLEVLEPSRMEEFQKVIKKAHDAQPIPVRMNRKIENKTARKKR